jgi:hypothetical protein
MSNNARNMTTEAIYRYLRLEVRFDTRRTDRILEPWYQAALFLVAKIKSAGWKWRDNFLREYVACALGEGFTNTISPYVTELMFRQHPELRKYAENPHGDGDLFEK